MYSGRAISQLTAITAHSGTFVNRRWPYHATVMNVFDATSRMMVFMEPPLPPLSTRVRRRGETGSRFHRGDLDPRLLPRLRGHRLAQPLHVDAAHLVLDV